MLRSIMRWLMFHTSLWWRKSYLIKSSLSPLSQSNLMTRATLHSYCCNNSHYYAFPLKRDRKLQSRSPAPIAFQFQSHICIHVGHHVLLMHLSDFPPISLTPRHALVAVLWGGTAYCWIDTCHTPWVDSFTYFDGVQIHDMRCPWHLGFHHKEHWQSSATVAWKFQRSARSLCLCMCVCVRVVLQVHTVRVRVCVCVRRCVWACVCQCVWYPPSGKLDLSYWACLPPWWATCLVLPVWVAWVWRGDARPLIPHGLEFHPAAHANRPPVHSPERDALWGTRTRFYTVELGTQAVGHAGLDGRFGRTKNSTKSSCSFLQLPKVKSFSAFLAKLPFAFH